jgi:hypothetical protein
VTVIDTHFRSNRGLCKPPNDATPPTVDPDEALQVDEEAQRAARSAMLMFTGDAVAHEPSFDAGGAGLDWRSHDEVPASEPDV